MQRAPLEHALLQESFYPRSCRLPTDRAAFPSKGRRGTSFLQREGLPNYTTQLPSFARLQAPFLQGPPETAPRLTMMALSRSYGLTPRQLGRAMLLLAKARLPFAEEGSHLSQEKGMTEVPEAVRDCDS